MKKNGSHFHQLLLKWLHSAEKWGQRQCKHEHGSVSQWLEPAAGKERRKIPAGWSWNPLCFQRLKHRCCKSQPSNSPVIIPAHKGMGLDVEWSLDSHSTLGQIPGDRPKIHPGQPGLGRAFPWSSVQCWVKRSLALSLCQHTAPNQVGLKYLHCSQPGHCLCTHTSKHRICLNTHVRLRRFRCLNTYNSLSDQPDTHLSHSGDFLWYCSQAPA